MNISQEVRKVIAIGPEDLLNVTELIIVINPGSGTEETHLFFDKQFKQIFPASKKECDQVVAVSKSTKTPMNCKEITFEKPVEENSSLEKGQLLPPISKEIEEIKFRNQKVIPYTIKNAHEPLQDFIRKFIFWGLHKTFEEKAYAFFIDNEEGKKFGIKTLDSWGIGLWMMCDPYGLLEACKGAPTFRAMEFAFSRIKEQLKERVENAHVKVYHAERVIPQAKRKYAKRVK